jgi:hypothetical protein
MLKSSPADLSKLTEHIPRFKFYMLPSQWKGKMPGWKNSFTKKEIDSLEAYVYSFKK